MGAGDVVVGAEVRADAGGDRLLARVEVHEPGDLAGGELRVEPLLELADGPHHAVRLEQLLGAELPRGRGRRDGRHGLSSSCVGGCSEEATPAGGCSAVAVVRAAWRMTASTSIVSGPSASRTVTCLAAAALDLALAVQRQAAARLVEPNDLARRHAARARPPPPARPVRARAARAWSGAPVPRRTCSPWPAPRSSGWTKPATADRPTALGLAKVTNSSVRSSPRHSARAPTKRALRDGDVDEREVGLGAVALDAQRALAAQRVRAAAAGDDQPGREAGDGRLAHLREDVVGAGGEAADRRVAARLGDDAVGAVAAEHDDGAARRARASSRPRRVVSWAVLVSGIRSSSSSGNGAAARPSIVRRPCSWRWSALDRPSRAGIISARSTPVAPSPASSRNTIPALSALPNTDAPATRRRMSRPEAGLATIPTVVTS